MFISGIANFFKWCWLHITRIFKNVFKNFLIKISVFFVIFSFIISLFFMMPALFLRVPVFSYFIDTLSLPLAYELEGKVILVDEEDEPIDQMVTVYIGGYSTEVFSGDTFILNFSSESTDHVYITIEYKDQSGIQTTITKKFETKGNTTLKEVIKRYV